MNRSPISHEAVAGMPNGIHIVTVVYGPVYTALLCDVTLWNMASLVLEIPEDIREQSCVRILTTEIDFSVIESSPALKLLRARIRVELLSGATLSGYDKQGDYGPMIENQRLLVVEAARKNAALIFFGPDLIYSRGSFALFIDCLRKGYRLLIGPGPRINRETARVYLQDLIAASSDGSFALTGEKQTDLLFDHWHKINDQFLIEAEDSIWWKAYVCYRPHPDEVYFRFFQGPTFMGWPLKAKDDFDGFIDHGFPELCCSSWREMYVVLDGNDCLALDLTDSNRIEVMDSATFPRVFLLYSLFQHNAIKNFKLLYALRTCRIHKEKGESGPAKGWLHAFDRAIDPLIFLAMAERWVRDRLGPRIAAGFQFFCLVNTHTLSLVLGQIAPFLLRKWKLNHPRDLTADASTRRNANYSH